MHAVVSVVGAVILGIGFFVLVAPNELRKVMRLLLIRRWLPLASALRIVVGALFVMAARDTRAPVFILVVGVVLILAGITLPALGAQRTERFAVWWVGRPNAVIRLWALAAMVFGTFVAAAGM